MSVLSQLNKNIFVLGLSFDFGVLGLSHDLEGVIPIGFCRPGSSHPQQNFCEFISEPVFKAFSLLAACFGGMCYVESLSSRGVSYEMGRAALSCTVLAGGSFFVFWRSVRRVRAWARDVVDQCVFELGERRLRSLVWMKDRQVPEKSVDLADQTKRIQDVLRNYTVHEWCVPGTNPELEKELSWLIDLYPEGEDKGRMCAWLGQGQPLEQRIANVRAVLTQKGVTIPEKPSFSAPRVPDAIREQIPVELRPFWPEGYLPGGKEDRWLGLDIGQHFQDLLDALKAVSPNSVSGASSSKDDS